MGILKGTILVGILGLLIAITLREQEPLPLIFAGHVEPGFEAVERAFRENFEKGFESDGAAFAVCHKGKMVVDIWGGYADKSAARAWKEDTISVAFSSTKGVAALCVAQLVDRGHLKYDDLVTKYWPEFGKHGKENVTVKMLVGHEAGLVGLDGAITKEAVKNWKLMSKLFEDQIPNWPPGTKAGYHLVTHGWICDQLIRRADPKHRSVGQYFKEEIAEPFGIDFYIGLPRDQFYRASRITMPTMWDRIRRLDDMKFVKFMWRLLTTRSNPTFQTARENPDWLLIESHKYMPFNDPEIHEMEIPGANGIGTARALAKLYCLVADPKFPILSKEILDKISKPQRITPADESLFGLELRWGFGLMHWLKPDGSHKFGHPGYGGQAGKVDLEEHLAYGYLRNNLAPEVATELVRTMINLEKATYESIRKLKN